MQYKRLIIRMVESMDEDAEEEFLRIIYTIVIRHVIKIE